MKLRVANKILAGLRRGPGRWSRDQVRRAAIRALSSPLQITSRAGVEGDLWGNAACARRYLGGRVVGVSACCAVFEQKNGIHDAVKRDGRIYLERRQ